MPEAVSADFVVRRGEGESVSVELRLGGKAFPLPMAAGRAAEVGRAMLAGAAVARSPTPLASDAVIETCIFPVEEWWTGTSNADGAPMLVLAVAGGVQLAFRLSPASAEQCGAALARTGAGARAATQPAESPAPDQRSPDASA